METKIRLVGTETDIVVKTFTTIDPAVGGD
jgi:hypothetical protein